MLVELRGSGVEAAVHVDRGGMHQPKDHGQRRLDGGVEIFVVGGKHLWGGAHSDGTFSGVISWQSGVISWPSEAGDRTSTYAAQLVSAGSMGAIARTNCPQRTPSSASSFASFFSSASAGSASSGTQKWCACRSASKSDASCTNEGGNQRAIRDHQSYLPIGE